MIINAKLKLPKTKTKIVWAGLYGGHYDQIVFFKKKPVKSKDPHNHIDGDWYDCTDNKELIVGDMTLSDFQELYPKVNLKPYLSEIGRPKGIEIPEVFKINIEAFWDKYGMKSIHYHFDF
jgi:hypothetical protein